MITLNELCQARVMFDEMVRPIRAKGRIEVLAADLLLTVETPGTPIRQTGIVKADNLIMTTLGAAMSSLADSAMEQYQHDHGLKQNVTRLPTRLRAIDGGRKP